jgi:CubicO group peptidase (beta-lactamase class C family)
VTGFAERGTVFERLSPDVPPQDAQLVRARPRGAAPYAYQPPPDLGDGIAVGGLESAGLDTSVANAIVRGAVDGTFADLHSVLVYRHGRLVLEEYFHGYGRDRPHPLRSATKSVVSALVGIAVGDVRWNFTLSAENAGSFAQLYLRPRDMLKLGILFRQEGRWDGRQVVPAEWVRRSTARQTEIGDLGYGYYWWLQWLAVPTPSGTRRVDVVVATGNGGQKIFLVPSLDQVAVFTGGAYNAGDTPPNAVMSRVLLPALLAAAR